MDNHPSKIDLFGQKQAISVDNVTHFLHTQNVLEALGEYPDCQGKPLGPGPTPFGSAGPGSDLHSYKPLSIP